MDFEELKNQYNDRIKEIQNELNDLESHVSMSLNEYEKILRIYQKFTVLLKEGKWKEAIDILKINEFENINDLNEKSDQLDKNLRNSARRFEQIEVELKKEFIICPECEGIRYKITYEIVELDEHRVRIPHHQECVLCSSRGRIPTSELLNCG